MHWGSGNWFETSWCYRLMVILGRLVSFWVRDAELRSRAGADVLVFALLFRYLPCQTASVKGWVNETCCVEERLLFGSSRNRDIDNGGLERG